MNNYFKPYYCLPIVSVLIFFGCSKQKNIIGCYRSNYPEAGIFAHNIHLNSDSTFSYKFSGDMIVQDGKGIYHLKKDTIYLVFDKNIKRDITDIFSSNTIVTKDMKLLYENEKIRFINSETNHVINGKESLYIKNQRCFFWGGHYIKKRFFLKRYACIN